MSNPLDYEARRDKERDAEAASRNQREQILQAHLEEKAQFTPRSAFEACVLSSRDLPAVGVIEAALRKQGIAARKVRGQTAGEMEICVPAPDLQAAQLVAAEIFARRKRIADASPRRKPEADTDPLRNADRDFLPGSFDF